MNREITMRKTHYLAGTFLGSAIAVLAVPTAAFAQTAPTETAATAESQDEEVAESIGHDIGRIRLWIVCLTALGVGACVAICGAIGFVGLVAPIFARRVTAGHPGRAILPAALIGGTLLLAADLAVRTAPLGRTLPIGVVTALLGAPFFLWLVAHTRWGLGR